MQNYHSHIYHPIFPNGQCFHSWWPIVPLFHPCGEVVHEVMAEYPGNPYQHRDIPVRLFEQFVHVALVTGDLAGEPLHFAPLPLQLRSHHLPDVQSLYLLLFRHKIIRELLFGLRFWTTLTPKQESPRKSVSVSPSL